MKEANKNTPTMVKCYNDEPPIREIPHEKVHSVRQITKSQRQYLMAQ